MVSYIVRRFGQMIVTVFVISMIAFFVIQLPPGDFVRHCRQVIDLLDQLTADERLGRTARAAIDGVRRGLVAQEIGR